MTAPHNLSAERGIIEGCLFDPAAAARIPSLQPEHFYSPFHALVWRTMRDSIESSGTVTPECIQETLSGGPVYEAHATYFAGFFSGDVYTAPEVEMSAQIVRDLWGRRRIISLAEAARTAALGKNGQGYINPAAILAGLSDDLEAVQGVMTGVLEHHDFAGAGIEALADPHAAAAGRIPTGYSTLDGHLGGGLTAGQNTILAAATSVGKSALAVCIALNAVGAGHTVGYFSLEMTRHDVAMRGGCYLAHQPADPVNPRYNDAARGPADQASAIRLRRVFEDAASRRLYIDDRGGLRVPELSERYQAWCNEARRQKVARPRLVIVDNLGNLTPDRGGERTDETGRLSKALLAFAKRHDVALLTLHHLNRASVRDERPPRLHDLRQSGEIEQDANAVLFLHRDAHFAKQAMDAATSEDEHRIAHDRWMRTRNMAEIIIAKNRGPLGRIILSCDMASNAFWTPQDNVTAIWGNQR